MTAKNQKFSPSLADSFQLGSSLVFEQVPSGVSFHEVLSDRADDSVVEGAKQNVFKQRFVLALRSRVAHFQTSLRPLMPLWSWLHRKYTLTATKRLRVAETVSLGEKRFVALVTIEGREFLIGGGSTGVSLLTELGTPSQTPKRGRTKLSVEGISE
jgi:hypothetical protein